MWREWWLNRSNHVIKRTALHIVRGCLLLAVSFNISCGSDAVSKNGDSSYRYAEEPVIEKSKEPVVEKTKDYVVNVPTLAGPIPDDVFVIEPVQGQFRYCYKDDTLLYLTLKEIGSLLRSNGGAQLDSNVVIRINTHNIRTRSFSDIIDTVRTNGIVHYYFWTAGVDRYQMWHTLIRAQQ